MKPKTKLKKGMSNKFKIVNVVAVMNCGFHIKLREVWKDKVIVAINESNGGKGNVYTVVKPKGVTSKGVTIFYNGNMISVGNKSVSEARRNLEATKTFLRHYKFKPKIKRR